MTTDPKDRVIRELWTGVLHLASTAVELGHADLSTAVTLHTLSQMLYQRNHINKTQYEYVTVLIDRINKEPEHG
jgi:hypothetical protein